MGDYMEERGGADGGLLGAFVTRMPYTNVTNSSSLLRESGQGLVNHLLQMSIGESARLPTPRPTSII